MNGSYVWTVILLLIVLVAVFLPTISKKPKYVLVKDEKRESAVNTYNLYIQELQDLNERFINTLNSKQREIVLQNDVYAHSKCAYLVEEFDETADILSSRMKEASSCIEKQKYEAMWTILISLDKDIEYLKELTNHMKNIEVKKSETDSGPYIFDANKNEANDIGSEKMVSYFAGCKTRDDILIRYKALVKVFHPDAKAGNEKIFKQIQAEFDELIKVTART